MPSLGPRVTLRPLVPDDAHTMAGWAEDSVFRDHAGWRLDRTRDEIAAFHHGLIACPPDDLVRLGAVVDAHLVGYVDLHGDQPGRRELGFLVGGLERWGRGLGTRLGAAGLVHGFEVLGLDEIWAEALDADEASVRILRRLGLVETGLGEEDEFLGRATRYRQLAISRAAWNHDPGATSPDS